MAHSLILELDGAELNADWRKAQQAFPFLAGLSNVRIRPESAVLADADTAIGAVEVTVRMKATSG